MMVLSTTTFALDPGSMKMLKGDKINAHVQTYSSVQYFSWGTAIVGKTIPLKWNAMPSTMFDALDAVYQSDVQVVWQPKLHGSTVNYNVEVLNLTGEYWISQESSANYNRINCQLDLLIMSEVT